MLFCLLTFIMLSSILRAPLLSVSAQKELYDAADDVKAVQQAVTVGIVIIAESDNDIKIFLNLLLFMINYPFNIEFGV